MVKQIVETHEDRDGWKIRIGSFVKSGKKTGEVKECYIDQKGRNVVTLTEITRHHEMHVEAETCRLISSEKPTKPIVKYLRDKKALAQSVERKVAKRIVRKGALN